jgi:two-component system, cell cycle sensor histidine kinase and response regulator CckA
MLSDTLAHDINNLLMIVTGCGDRLRTQGTLSADQRAEIDRIALATRHASWLADQLMIADTGGGPRGIARIDSAVSDAARLLAPTLSDRITLEVETPASAVWVPLAPSEIAQIILNLALNARDAMPDGGRLTITAAPLRLDEQSANTLRLPPGDYVHLEVRDTGHGMSAETRARAFEAFFTTKDHDGTGLGLASVHHLAQRCGGTVDLRSVPGQGTRVSLLLPTCAPPARHDDATVPDVTLRARPGERVLVVDDEPDVRELVAAMLRAFGYDTREAASGAEAIRSAAAHPVDLLVADVDLPDMPGVELATRMRHDAGSPRVLLVSGYVEVPAGNGSTAPLEFLKKPFSGSTLARKVRDVLDAPPQAADPS